jgi:hypothetical protein
VWLGGVVLSGIAFAAGLYLFGGVSAGEKQALQFRIKSWLQSA